MADPQTTAFEKWAQEYYSCDVSIIPRQARDAWETGIASIQLPVETAVIDCPHATPFRYCPRCVVNPCPLGLKQP